MNGIINHSKFTIHQLAKLISNFQAILNNNNNNKLESDSIICSLEVEFKFR